MLSALQYMGELEIKRLKYFCMIGILWLFHRKFVYYNEPLLKYSYWTALIVVAISEAQFHSCQSNITQYEITQDVDWIQPDNDNLMFPRKAFILSRFLHELWFRECGKIWRAVQILWIEWCFNTVISHEILQQLVQANIKEISNLCVTGPLCKGNTLVTSHQWISLIKGRYWESVSIQRLHVLNVP